MDRNTLRIEYADGNIAIRLHDTDIITLTSEGNTILNSGGWRTVTTKDRMNKFAAVPYIRQENGLWYVGGHLYYDGITFDRDGNLLSEDKTPDMEAVKKLKKQIAGYVKLITKDNLPQPDGGDCLYCRQTTEGDTIGDAFESHEHLQLHLDEGYVHGSLLVNAMRESGYRDQQIGLHYSMNLHDTFKRSVRKYVQKRLMPEVVTR